MSICEMCGVELASMRAKFCKECQRLKNLDAINKKRLEEKSKRTEKKCSCEVCNAEFTPASGRQKYCLDCRKKVQKMHEKAYREKVVGARKVKKERIAKVKISEPKLKVKIEKPSCIDQKFLVRGAITYSSGVSSIRGGGI